VTSAKRSDSSLFLARLGVDVTLTRLWKLEDLVPGMKRFAISVVWKTFEPARQRRTIVAGTSGLRRDAESPLDEDDRSNKKRIVTPGTSGLRRDPDYSRSAKVLKK
jgi:hypothetical protein